ncbi:MAG: hypothetical protein ACJAXS_003410, partial [Colwellia sp.]
PYHHNIRRCSGVSHNIVLSTTTSEDQNIEVDCFQ